MSDISHLQQDAGQLVPYARKHLAQEGGKKSDSATTLAEIWPEPDWRALVAQGQDRELVARKFVGYQSIRNRPRNGGVCKFSSLEWERAYILAVRLLREIYDAALTVEDTRNVRASLRAKLGFSEIDCKKVTANNLVYWACGFGGSRYLHTVGPSTLRLQEMNRWLAKLGWPENDVAWRTSIVPARLERDGTWRVAHVEGDRWIFLSGVPYATEDEAIAASLAAAEAKLTQAETSSKLIPKRPLPGTDVERVGPDHRNGADVSAEDLMVQFGLRGIQYGNSVSIKDRQLWLNQTFDGLADLADVLGMKRSWIGLQFRRRSLALAIGARGQGLSGASAHYESGLRVINQTYRSGYGALAHEFGHALDHRIGLRFFVDALATENLYAHSPNASNKDRNIIKSLRAITRMVKDEECQFYAQAIRIAQLHKARKYWTEVIELYARSFEAFVEDSLSAMGRSNPSLVYGTLPHHYTAANSIACPYPIGNERDSLNALHAALIRALLAPD